MGNNLVGGKAAYETRHARVRRARGKASSHRCTYCSGQARDWALIHGCDGFDVDDYMPLCRKCHQIYDQVHERQKKIKPPGPGRVRGERHHQARLNWDIVRRMRALQFAEDMSHLQLAEKFGVTKRTVTIILSDKGWRE